MLDELTPVDLRALYVFHVIANCGGFTRAQEELGIGQSTISLQLSTLEKRLGYRLCDRGRGGFRLTERGRGVLDAFVKLQQATELFTDTAAGLSKRIVGTLKIGLLDHTATDERFSTVELIRAFKNRASEVEIEIVQDVQPQLREMISSQRLDLAIGAFSTTERLCHSEVLYPEHQFIHCGKAHPLLNSQAVHVTAESLESAHWVKRGYVLAPRSGFPLVMTSTPATAANLEAVAILLQAAPLLGYLPSHFAKRFIETKTLHRLTSNYAIEYDIVLLSRLGRRETSAMKMFRELAKSQASDRQIVEARMGF